MLERNNTHSMLQTGRYSEIKTAGSYDDYVTGEKGVPYTIGAEPMQNTLRMQLLSALALLDMPNPCGEGRGEEHMPDECNSVVTHMMKALKIYIISSSVSTS